VHLPAWLPIVLGLSAWTFYVADRLFDAATARTPLRPRHRFHWDHRRIFIPVAVVAAIIAIVLVQRSMPFAARTRNSFLAAAAVAYFGSVHSPWRASRFKLRLPKELLVGVIFTLACALPVWARASVGRTEMPPVILCFIALAWLNCHAIEVWESGEPLRDLSVAAYALALSLSSLAAAVCVEVTGGGDGSRFAALLLAASISAALLAWLDRKRLAFSPVTLRAAADLVLLTPLFLLIA
jgi:hypothetical protein